MALRFSEEIILLLLSEDVGTLDRFSSRNMNYVLAGATLMDLALENRVDSDQHHVFLVDATPLGDPLLDPTLADIAQHPEIENLRDWIKRLSKQGDDLRVAVLRSLAKRGILESSEEGMLFLDTAFSRTRRYPATDDRDAEQEVRLRVMRLLFSDDIPDPKDIVIVSLIHACQLFENLLTARELDEVRPRIELLTKMDLIGQALHAVLREAVADSDAPWEVADSHSKIPVIKGLPILGSALDLGRDMTGFLVKQYRKHGPLFRLRILSEDIYVFVGPHANEFVSRYGNLCLSSHFIWNGHSNELGVTRSVANMDGSEHLRMRRVQAYGYSRGIYEKQMSKAIDILQDQINSWRVGETLPGFSTMQNIVTEQIGQIATGYSSTGYVEDFSHYMDDIMNTTVIRTLPMFVRRRRLTKTIERLNEFAAKVIEANLGRGGGPDEERSLISDVIQMHRQDPVFLPELDLKVLVLTPFLAGVDTVAAECSFGLYHLLKNPELLERVRAEADELFADGKPNSKTLRRADVLVRFTMEVLRLYPVAPAVIRQVANSFDFYGYRLEAGRKVMIATSVSHFLPECFPEPDKFDIDRYLPERAENRQKYAYVPFGLGLHRCLGSGFAHPQIALTLATILRHVELSLDPQNYTVKTTTTPTLRPKKSFKLKVVNFR